MSTPPLERPDFLHLARGPVATAQPPSERSGVGEAHNSPSKSPAVSAEGTQPRTADDAKAALRFLQRWQTLASAPADTASLVTTPEQARAQAERLQWQLAVSPALALQAQGSLDPARVAQWLQH